MTLHARPNLTQSCARAATAFATVLVIALGGCGGASDPEPRPGFEPVTCSDQPSPCACGLRFRGWPRGACSAAIRLRPHGAGSDHGKSYGAHSRGPIR